MPVYGLWEPCRATDVCVGAQGNQSQPPSGPSFHSGGEVGLRLTALGVGLQTRNNLSPGEVDVGELFSRIVRRPPGVAEEQHRVSRCGAWLQLPGHEI